MNRLFFSLLILIVVLNACTNEQQELQNKIEKQEQAFNKKAVNGETSRKDVKSLILLYEKYYKENPTDTLSAGYLMKAGEMANLSQMREKAIQFYDAVEVGFKKSSHYPMAIFMKAFIYDEMQDTAKARIYYNKFLTKFPKHKLAKDARISKQNLGKTLDEIVKGFSSKKPDEPNK